MNGVLKKIVLSKRKEVDKIKSILPIERLKKSKKLNDVSISMEEAILNGSGLIAEFKRASPSKGIIKAGANVGDITRGYQNSGASAISVLTDKEFFKADKEDLLIARKNVSIPLLRKDFVIDPYQIYQAKDMGADCILLIAAILSPQDLKLFVEVAYNLGMEVIVEVHHLNELDKLSGNEKIVGVNNRNLDTFEVDINTSIVLTDYLKGVVKISESGLDSESDIENLLNVGYNGFLVGESFMRKEDSAKACNEFVEKIKRIRA